MITSEMIEKAIYDLCVRANTQLPKDVLTKIFDAYNSESDTERKYALGLILENARLSYEQKMPLCQDTGQVLVFLKSRNYPVNINEIVNSAVQKAYQESFYRKSVVKDALFDRANSKTNTPCMVYTEIADVEGMEITLLLKGAGSENVSTIKMLSPTATEDEIVDLVKETVQNSGAKACPPYFIGIGIGGTMEYAALLSKKALICEVEEKSKDLSEKIKNAVNELNIGVAGLGGNSTVLDVKIKTDFTHIACMPVAITVNCHSDRYAKVVLNEDGGINIDNIDSIPVVDIVEPDFVKVHSSEIDKIRNLQIGQNILLSGEIYTARDAAHKRLVEMIDNGEELPFDLKDKIIFYAGPCPQNSTCAKCVTGSIGPTTSSRMDKYAGLLYGKGLLGTIGKGDRNDETKKAIKSAKGIYFTAFGGIACYLAQKFVKKELIAFEDLDTESISRFEVEDLPLKVNFV